MPLPATVTYSDENTPEWIIPIKHDTASPYTLTITLHTYDKISISVENLEAVKVDLQQALADTGLTVADVNTIITFLRFTSPRLTLVVEGEGTTIFEITLPPGVKVVDIVRADTGERIPFSFNEAANSFIFSITFTSAVELHVLLSNIQTTLNVAIQAITTVLLVSAVVKVIMQSVREIVEVTPT